MKGLKCPICKTELSNVIETRGRFRKRKCFNGHSFETEERAIKVHKREALRSKVLKLLALNAGISQRDPGYTSLRKAAQQFHTSVDTVRRIVRGEIAQRQMRKPTSYKGTLK